MPSSSVGQLSSVLGPNRVGSWPSVARRLGLVLRLASCHRRFPLVFVPMHADAAAKGGAPMIELGRNGVCGSERD